MSPECSPMAALQNLENRYWSDEIEQILVKYRENLRLRNPKRWTKETILRKFRTLRMQDMNIERFEEDTKEFKRLRSLSISRNSISMLKNLPLNLKALYAFRNNIREVDTNTEQPDLIALGLGFNRIGDISSIVKAFPLLRVLDIGYNHLTSLDDLIENLKKLKHLEHLTIEGNPCTLLSSYKRCVSKALPRLRSLNGKPLSSSGEEEEEAKEETCSFKLTIDSVSRTWALDGVDVDLDESEILERHRENRAKSSCFEIECSFSGQTWTSETCAEFSVLLSVSHSTLAPWNRLGWFLKHP